MCSRFRERVHSTVRTESGGRTLEAITDRRGVWVVRAEAAGSSLALDAWYDSLAVTRTSAGVSVTPDAGGILGGRYQGTLASDGRYVPSVHPFIPDELAEIVRLDDALDRLFPRLPDRPLRVGESWHEPPAMEIQRMPDSADGGIPLRRYRFTASEEGQESAGGDSLPIELQQRTDERGDVVWHPTIGLLRYARSATVGTMLPPSRAMPRPMRTTLVQEAVLERVREVDAADCR